MHHFATNKSSKYTQSMSDIADKYRLKLDGDWNKEALPHQGKHPNKYHNFVLDGMKRASSGAGSDTNKFLELFDKYVKEPVRNNPGVAKNMQERCSKKGLNFIADALSNIGGCGGEIGLYNNDDNGIGGGSSMSPEQMAEMGIVSTEIAIVNKLSRRIIGRRKESTPSFWTTYFSWGNNSSKEEIFTLNIFNFKDKDSASSFANNLKKNHDKAVSYNQKLWIG